MPKGESRPAPDLPNLHSLLIPRSSHLAFTLVELLIAILIIGILASALLGVAAVASENAREAKTRNIIARIHTLLMEQYDTYKSRRIDTSFINANPSTAPGSPQQKADNRLLALRQLMKMEIPDRWSDILNDTVDNVRPNASQAVFDNLKSNNITNKFAIPPTEALVGLHSPVSKADQRPG